MRDLISGFIVLADRHSWLAAFVALLAFSLLNWPFRLAARWIRHRNLVAHGWPPAHLDADGDARTAHE